MMAGASSRLSLHTMPSRPHIVSFRWICLTCLSLFAAPSSQAFVVSWSPQSKKLYCTLTPHQPNHLFASTNKVDGDASIISTHHSQLSHSDIEWRLRPPEGTSRIDRLKFKIGANILRLESKLKGNTLPPVLCPRGGRALLEAYHKGDSGRRKRKIARFGFTTARGPSSTEIDATITELYNINPPPLSAAIAAIIYMFVEKDYRSRNVGALALDVISAIQYVQAVDFTVLVADDNGSGGLVRWYEKHGYLRAPLLQNLLGSPNEQNGVAMISPVKVDQGFFDKCVIKWW